MSRWKQQKAHRSGQQADGHIAFLPFLLESHHNAIFGVWITIQFYVFHVIYLFMFVFLGDLLLCAKNLARELVDIFTAKKMGKVFFTNSGSEANDSQVWSISSPITSLFHLSIYLINLSIQVKLVWYYNNALGRPNKKKFIARKKSYHGSTLISASLTG